MKKLTIFFIILFFCTSGLVAESSFPKSKTNNRINPCLFVSSDGLNLYKYIAWEDSETKKYSLTFINTSLASNIMISINIEFANEKKFDEVFKDFDISNVDMEFKKLKQRLDAKGFIPDYYYSDNKLTSVVYMINKEI